MSFLGDIQGTVAGTGGCGERKQLSPEQLQTQM